MPTDTFATMTKILAGKRQKLVGYTAEINGGPIALALSATLLGRSTRNNRGYKALPAVTTCWDEEGNDTYKYPGLAQAWVLQLVRFVIVFPC